jgi:hypothetical protein
MNNWLSKFEMGCVRVTAFCVRGGSKGGGVVLLGGGTMVAAIGAAIETVGRGISTAGARTVAAGSYLMKVPGTTTLPGAQAVVQRRDERRTQRKEAWAMARAAKAEAKAEAKRAATETPVAELLPPVVLEPAPAVAG